MICSMFKIDLQRTAPRAQYLEFYDLDCGLSYASMAQSLNLGHHIHAISIL